MTAQGGGGDIPRGEVEEEQADLSDLHGHTIRAIQWRGGGFLGTLLGAVEDDAVVAGVGLRRKAERCSGCRCWRIHGLCSLRSRALVCRATRCGVGIRVEEMVTRLDGSSSRRCRRAAAEDEL